MIQLLTLRNKREILNHLLVSHLVQVWWPSSLIFSSITTAQRWIGDRDHVNAFVRDLQGDHVIYKMWSRDGEKMAFKEDDGSK